MHLLAVNYAPINMHVLFCWYWIQSKNNLNYLF